MSLIIKCKHTRDRGVLAEVTGLVAAEKTLGLDLGSGTTGELLVEADDTLHTQGVGSSANGLLFTQICQLSRSFSPCPSLTVPRRM